MGFVVLFTKKKIAAGILLWIFFWGWILSLYRFQEQFPLLQLPSCILNKSMPCNDGYLYFGKGWSYPENTFRWTKKKHAFFYFKFKTKYQFISFSMKFLDSYGLQVVDFFFNNHKLGTVKFQQGLKIVTYKITRNMFSENGINEVELVIPNAIRPEKGNIRNLGVALNCIRLNST